MSTLLRQPAIATALVAASLAAACQCSDHHAAHEQLLVLTASSLTDVFSELESDFERTSEGVDVVLSTAGSQVLRLQLEQGVQADVFASANAEHMSAVVEAGLVQPDVVFATNELVVVTPKSNPARLESLSDLPNAARIVLGTTYVPVGAYARAMLDRATTRYGNDFRERVEASVVSEEANVRLVLAKVQLGEADAAIVYRTDAAGSDDVHMIEVPDDLDARASYHLGILHEPPNPAAAQAWVELVTSPAGRAVLRRHGFSVPDDA